jgi:hypothetical protein
MKVVSMYQTVGGSAMFFDRFDVAEAYYLFFAHYHEGQASDKYRRLSRMSRYFKPRPSLSVETLTENGREIYEALAAREEARTAR